MRNLELIGREKELKILRDLTAVFLENRESRQALWLHVFGEDGIGKTRLLEELVLSIQALSDFHIFTNRYSPPVGYPFGAAAMAVSHDFEIALWESEYTKKEKLESHLALLGRFRLPPELLQIDRTLPVLGRLVGIDYPAKTGGRSMRRGQGKLNIFAAVGRYLAALRHGRRGPGSPEPVLLWFEDLDRMDRLSLELLVHLVQKKDALWPLVLITSSRSSIASELAYLPEFNQFSLGSLSRLSRKKIIQALEAASPSSRLSSQLQQLLIEGTPGNARLLCEAYRLLSSITGRDSRQETRSGLIGALEAKTRALDTLDLNSVIHERLDRLEHRMRAILQSVALLGPYSSLELLASMLSRIGYPLDDLEDRLDRLAAEGFLRDGAGRETGRTICLSYPLLAELLTESVPGDRLTGMHQQAAELLWQSMEENDHDYVFAVGEHLTDAYFLKEDWAVEAITRCGDRLYSFEDYAGAARAYDEAAARQGLECAEEGTVLSAQKCESFTMLMIKAGKARLGDGRDKEAFSALTAALQIASSRGLVCPQVEACLELGEIMVQRGDWSGAERFYEQGHQTAVSAGELDLAAACLIALGTVEIRREDFTRAETFLKQALELGREAGPAEQRLDALLNLGYIYQCTGSLEQAESFYGQVLETARVQEDETAAVTALSNLGRIKYEQENIDEALDFFHRALERLRASADIQQIGNWLGYIGSIYFSTEEFETAIDYYHQALCLAERSGQTRNQGVWLANLGNAYYEIKEVSKALEYYLQALELAREEQDYSYVCTLLSTIGVYYYNLRQYDRAWHYFKDSLSIAMEIGNLPISVQNILYRGSILAARGDEKAALSTLAEGEALASEHNMADHQAVAQLFRGHIALQASDPKSARAHCEKAAGIAAGTGNRKLIAEIERAIAACSKTEREEQAGSPSAGAPSAAKAERKNKKGREKKKQSR
ncbi:MAG: tetratricopeptide repeat protein [Candidatus Glassbacteria bacterium]|nr:tetratricopeptide repeat protein [Candidatus Glassbacteria bacterium]